MFFLLKEVASINRIKESFRRRVAYNDSHMNTLRGDGNVNNVESIILPYNYNTT